MFRTKAERLRRGYSQVVVAYHAGMSVSDISRIETGRLRPYPSQLAKLAKALDLDAGTLVDSVPDADAYDLRPAFDT